MKMIEHNYLNLIIDEVRIYNRSLSAEEVWQRYNLGQSRITAGNYYYRNSTSDNVLWTTQNFRTANRGSFAPKSEGLPSDWAQKFCRAKFFVNPKASQFSLSEDNTNKKLTYWFNFTGNLNNNFLFALGTTGNINTTTGNPSSWSTGY